MGLRSSNDTELVNLQRLKRRGRRIYNRDGPGALALRSAKFVPRKILDGVGEKRELQYRFARRRVQRLLFNNVVFPPFTYIEVDPTDINYVTPVSEYTDGDKPDPENLEQCIFDIPYGTFSKRRRFGFILDGRWDRRETPFEDVFIYRGFKERFRDGIPWEDTVYVQRVEEYFAGQDEDFKGFGTLREFTENRLPFLDDLYETIAAGNYRKQLEQNGSLFNELTVNIGREGRIFFNSNGAHRLALSKLADVEYIPALVIVRHREWWENAHQSATRSIQSHPDLANDLV